MTSKTFDSIQSAILGARDDCNTKVNGRNEATAPKFERESRLFTEALVSAAIKNAPELARVDWSALRNVNIYTLEKVRSNMQALAMRSASMLDIYSAYMLREAIANNGHVSRSREASNAMAHKLNKASTTISTQFSSSALAFGVMGFCETGRIHASIDITHKTGARFVELMNS